MSSDAIVRTNGAAIQKPIAPSFEFTEEQRRIIRDTFLNGASESEAAVLMELARVRRLNPITRQIHFVKRWDSRKKAEVWSPQVGIDGFRSLAERTGLYDGQDEPEFEYDKSGHMKLCRVRVYRKDWSRPCVGVAHFSEYVQTTKEGGATQMWATKPHVMLAKCAEALAIRKAFPEDTSGLYAPEEMGSEERDVTPPPSKGSRTDELKAKLVAKTAVYVEEPPSIPQDAKLIAYEELPPPSEEFEPPPAQEVVNQIWPKQDLAKQLADSVLVKFGKNKDQPLSSLSPRDLLWHLETARKKVAAQDPKWGASDQTWLDAVEAEVTRRNNKL